MKNILSAGRYLEHHGSTILRSIHGHKCEIHFKESGYFSSSQNEVTGSVYDEFGKKIWSLSGRWDHSLSYFEESFPDSLHVIWRAKSFPNHFREMYGFSQFAVELNGILFYY